MAGTASFRYLWLVFIAEHFPRKPANGTVVDNNVPSPERHSIPLLHLKPGQDNIATHLLQNKGTSVGVLFNSGRHLFLSFETVPDPLGCCSESLSTSILDRNTFVANSERMKVSILTRFNLIPHKCYAYIVKSRLDVPFYA